MRFMGSKMSKESNQLNLFEKETPTTIKLPFVEFTNEARDKCRQCIHFYNTVKYNDKFINGYFCCHWIDIKNLGGKLLEDTKKGIADCFYRNKDSGHPFNDLRRRKGRNYLNLDGNEDLN
jgi:hypothetical protein